MQGAYQIFGKRRIIMRVSMAVGAVTIARDHKNLRQPEEWLPMYKEAGFECLDLGFTDKGKKDFFLLQDNWEERCHAIKELADELGIAFTQCHLPFVKKAVFAEDSMFDTQEGRDLFIELNRRGYEACRIMNIPHAVQHPVTYLDAVNNPLVQRERNYEYYAPLVEYGAKLGVLTAIENMRAETPRIPFIERYCENAYELIDLIDRFGDEKYVGACWDTGHANDSGIKDQGVQIRHIGSRLKTLHLNDNHYGARDQHQFPYMGEVDWDDVLQALIDIDYQGVLNEEVGVGIKSCPSEFQMTMLKFVRENAEYLARRYEELKKLSGK